MEYMYIVLDLLPSLGRGGVPPGVVERPPPGLRDSVPEACLGVGYLSSRYPKRAS